MRKLALLSFATLLSMAAAVSAQAPAAPRPVGKEVVLQTQGVGSIRAAIESKRYFELKAEGFRILMPAVPAKYSPSKSASDGAESSEGNISWTAAETDLVMMFGDVDPEHIAALTPGDKKKLIGEALAVVVEKLGAEADGPYRDITIASGPGKEVRFTKGSKVYVGRMWLSDSRLFSAVAVIRPDVDGAESLVKQALDSFETIAP